MSASTNAEGHDRFAAFKIALSDILSTFAQILDGLPTLDIWRE